MTEVVYSHKPLEKTVQRSTVDLAGRIRQVKKKVASETTRICFDILGYHDILYISFQRIPLKWLIH